MSLKTTLGILVLLLTTGCSLAPHLGSPRTKNIEVGVIAIAEMNVSNPVHPDVSFASFPLIQGSLTGTTTTSPVLYLPIKFGTTAALPIDELANLIEPLATLPTAQMKSDGLKVTPATTRLARVGTFFVKHKEDEVSIGAGLLDTQTRDTIFLAFFSEPSEVSGTVSAGDIEIRVDIRVQRAGLHWLRFVKPMPAVWRMEVASENTPISLVAQPQ